MVFFSFFFFTTTVFYNIQQKFKLKKKMFMNYFTFHEKSVCAPEFKPDLEPWKSIK